MKKIVFLLVIISLSCKDFENKKTDNFIVSNTNSVVYAKGFSLNHFKDYSNWNIYINRI